MSDRYSAKWTMWIELNVLEAMFYRKKLITNFKDIKEYDFL